MEPIKTAPPALRDYLVYLDTIMGRSKGTVNEYFLDLRTFFRFLLQKRGVFPTDMPFDEIPIDSVDVDLIESVTRSEVLDYLVFAGRERPKYHKSAETPFGNEARTRARKISALRSLYKYYCDKLQVFENNPTKSLDTPKARRELPKFLTLKQSLTLLSSVEGTYKERDYCILTLFLNCGMRVSELVSINLSDVSEDRLRILGKGNKERIIYLNDACRDAIDNYLPHRISPKQGHRNAMFISRIGRRMDVQTVKVLVKKYLTLAGLSQQHLSVHKLRHTAATLMYQNGVDVRTLKEVLGHENLDTTMIYTHVIDENLRDAAKMNPLNDLQTRQCNKESYEDDASAVVFDDDDDKSSVT